MPPLQMLFKEPVNLLVVLEQEVVNWRIKPNAGAGKASDTDSLMAVDA